MKYLLDQLADRDRLIEQLGAQIQALEQQKTVAIAERRAYQDALDHLLPSQIREAKQQRSGPHDLRSNNWRQVFEFIAKRYPNAVTNDNMMAFAVDSGLTLSRQALRAQLSTYTEKGLLERLDQGRYRATPEGRAMLGVELQDKEAAANSQSAAAPELSSAERV